MEAPWGQGILSNGSVQTAKNNFKHFPVDTHLICCIQKKGTFRTLEMLTQCCHSGKLRLWRFMLKLSDLKYNCLGLKDKDAVWFKPFKNYIIFIPNWRGKECM